MIIKNKTANADKLIGYGFESVDDKYVFCTDIVDGQLRLTVTLEGDELSTAVYDVATDEAYTLHLVAGAVGGFVGRVRAEIEATVVDIEAKCYDVDVFKEDYTGKILEYAREKYGDEAEYLWKQYPDYAVLRRKDTNKWYAVIMRVPPKKIGLVGEERVEIIDLRFDADELPNKVDGVRYFHGYHMNKKHWITILLDGSVSLDEILGYLDKSYVLAKKS